MTDEQGGRLPSSSFAEGCRLSNDPAMRSALQVCNRTEYRCDSSEPDVAQETTIRYDYSVQYVETAAPSTNMLLLYLQETILEHVAYGLNLTDCRQGSRRTLRVDSPAVAVSGLPRDTFTAQPSCEAGSCTGTVRAGVTVWAANEQSVEESREVAETSVVEVLDMLEEPGTIERVEFLGFVREESNAMSANWYQNRMVQFGFGGGLLLLLAALICCCCCCCCCCCRQRHRKRQANRQRGGRQQWQSLDEEQPIAQRDSLALRPQRSWMLRKARAAEQDGAVSEATGDLTNDQQHLSCDDSETSSRMSADHNNDSEQLLEVNTIHSSSTDAREQEAPDEFETDPYILHEVSDDDSEVAERWRNLHSVEAGSTQGYDQEIIEALGHIPFDGKADDG